MREERKADLERHVKEVNALLRNHETTAVIDDSDPEEWGGIENVSPEPVDHEAEYIDEDKYTTVTVEEVDISRDGMTKFEPNTSHKQQDDKDQGLDQKEDETKKTNGTRTRDKDKIKKPKKKKKAFRYESPAERKLNRAKVRAKNSKAARARRGDWVIENFHVI